MLDGPVRRRLDRPLAAVAARLDRPWLTPARLSLGGLVLSLASAALAAFALWPAALVAWWASRLLDGLDGPLARRRGGGTEAGGFLDITADFAAYGCGVVGVGVGATGVLSGRTAPTWEWAAFLAVLLAYYLNGTAFLAFSSAAERAGARLDSGRTFSFLGGLAEGTETIAVHSLWLLVPGAAPVVAWVWAGVVGLSAVQRVVVGHRLLVAAAAAASRPAADGGGA